MNTIPESAAFEPQKSVMTAGQARSHLRHEILVCGLSNAFFNGVIAWLLLKNAAPLLWSGEHSFVVDMTATSFILGFLIAIIVVAVQRRKMRNGKLAAIDLGVNSRLQRLVSRLPQSIMANGLCFGLLAIVVAVPIPLLAFELLGIEQIQARHYAVFKGMWAGLLSAILVSPMAMSGLRI